MSYKTIEGMRQIRLLIIGILFPVLGFIALVLWILYKYNLKFRYWSNKHVLEPLGFVTIS